MSDFKPIFENSNVDKSLPTISISTVLGMLQEPFNKEGVAEKTYNKHYNDVDSQYYHMTVEEIMDAWSAKGAESCRYGSLLDDYIGTCLTKTDTDMEMYKLDNNYDYDERLHGLCDSFDNFYSILSKSGDTEFIDREKTVYYKVPNTDYYIKGRFDALFRNNKTGKWIVIDWKSSGEIEKPNRWTKKLLGPAGRLDAINHNTYTLQTHFYKKTLVDMGYLPEGTTYDDVEVLIIHLPGHIIEGTNDNYEIVKQGFQFDSELMNRIFLFAVKKQELLNKKNNG